MLRLRICPNCQEETYSQKVYFCHRCGAELPAPPPARGGSEVDQPDAGRGETKPRVKEKSSKKRVMLAVAAALCAALVLVVGVGVYYYRQTNSSLPSLPSLHSPLKNEAFVADVNFEVPNHPFSAKGLAEIVPADVDLYLESVDPEILLPSLISEEDWTNIESVISEKVGLSVVEFASFLEDEFAVIQESTASAFLARVRDADFVEQKIAEVGEYEDLPAGRQGWQAKMVNGFLVVANSSELIQKIEEAQKKLTLNLSLTSGFAEARQKLPQTGQMFYFRQTRASGEKTDASESGRPYGKKKLDFIPDSMKGEAFVISKKDSGIVITGL